MHNCTGFDAQTNGMRCMADGFRCLLPTCEHSFLKWRRRN